MKRLSLLQRALFASVFAWACCANVSIARVIYVDSDAPGANDGTSWEDAFVDLQGALSVALAGDEIRVADGVYTPAGPNGSRDASFELVDGVAMYGSYAGYGAADPDARDSDLTPTVLSGDLNGDDVDGENIGENSFHVILAYLVGENTVLDGFAIEGGNANGENVGNRHCGGGILILGGGPAISDCLFEINRAKYGGAIASIGGGATINDCHFMSNIADYDGGAMFELAAYTEVRDSVFILNSAHRGGAVSNGNGSESSFNMCRFNGNHVDDSFGYGEAMDIRTGSNCFIRSTVFVDNAKTRFGTAAVHGDDSYIEVRGCSFTRTVLESSRVGVSCRGGVAVVVQSVFGTMGNSGLICYDGGVLSAIGCTILDSDCFGIWVQGSAVNVQDCLIAGVGGGSWGGGIRVGSDSVVSVANSTIVGNRGWRWGAGITGDSSKITLRNSVIWGNVADGETDLTAQISASLLETAEIRHCCIQGWLEEPGIDGNIGDDPLFVAGEGPDGVWGTSDDDVRLSVGSPCIDVGSVSLLPADALDLDGDGDIQEALPVDLDLMPRVLGESVDMGAFEYWVDVDGNGIPDECDLTCEAGCEVYPECGSYHDCNDDGIADEYCAADLDFDGGVRLSDLNLLKATLGCDTEADPYCECARFDLDGSGTIGTGDLNVIRANYGPCGD